MGALHQSVPWGCIHWVPLGCGLPDGMAFSVSLYPGSLHEFDRECASPLFHREFSALCTEEPETARAFLNQLLNHLNWSVSEFDQSVQQICQGAEQAPGGVLCRLQAAGCVLCAAAMGPCLTAILWRGRLGEIPGPRKCVIMFELSYSLCRLVEHFVSEGAVLFHGTPQARTNLVRVVEVMVHLLSRMTKSDLFDRALDTGVITLQAVKRVVVLSPIVGTLLNLTEQASVSKEGVLRGCSVHRGALGKRVAPLTRGGDQPAR